MRRRTRKTRRHGGANAAPNLRPIPNASPMPQICIGTGQYDKAHPESIGQIVSSALAAGYRHIDAADAYGPQSYKDALAAAIATSPVPRAALWITWKSDNITLENIQRAADVVGGYVDLYLIHHAYSGGTVAQFTILMEAQRQGLIRHFGLSNCEDIKILRKLRAKYPIFANQIQAAPPGGIIRPHHFKPRPRTPTFIADCNKAGIAVMLFGALSGISESASLYETEKDLVGFYFENRPKINRYYMETYLLETPNVLIVGTTSGSTLAQNMREFTDTMANRNRLPPDEMVAINDFLLQLELHPMNI